MSQTVAMNEKYFRRQAMYWLIVAAVVAVLWLVVWLLSATPVIANKADNEIKSSDLPLPATITELNELKALVKPLDNAVLVRDLRSYPDEFKDKNYFTDIGSRYAVQLMDVGENEVIVDYLNGRKDRADFAYFRYTDGNKKQRYVLTYGKFTTAEEAKAALASVNFALPDSIKPTAVKVSSLLPMIDNYERGQDITDLASTQPRRIRLQATGKEIPVRAATAADEELARVSRQRAQEQEAKQQAQQAAQAQEQSQFVPPAAKAGETAPTPAHEELPMAPTAQPESHTAQPPAAEKKPAPATTSDNQTESGQ